MFSFIGSSKKKDKPNQTRGEGEERGGQKCIVLLEISAIEQCFKAAEINNQVGIFFIQDCNKDAVVEAAKTQREQFRPFPRFPRGFPADHLLQDIPVGLSRLLNVRTCGPEIMFDYSKISCFDTDMSFSTF